MQHTDLDFDELVQKMHVLCPNLPKSQEINERLRNKLEEQLKDKVAKVELEQLDLKYIIQNVKKSLSEFQRRIDESVAKQHSRRSTRVRKTIPHDPTGENFFDSKSFRKSDLYSSSIFSKADKEQNCCKNKRCQQTESDLVGLVQVESLPVSASTNLVTILIPSILQEKLHSCKYKISIDLNRLDLTKRILDLNVSQIDSDLKENDLRALEASEGQECKVTYEIKDDTDVQLVLDKTQNAGEISPNIEVKSSPIETSFATSLEPVVSILKEKDEIPSSTKKRGSKRKEKKPPSNDPPKKRGRKPGSKNKAKCEKSELARYVEMFECNGCSPSSAVSQIVTSTTQNWDILPEQTGQIAYFMNGEWTTLSALSSNGQQPIVSTTNGTLNLEDTTGNETFIPFDDFVNFIDNPAIDVGNNVIAQVLNGVPDAPDIALNLQEQNAGSLDVELNQPSNSNENTQALKFNNLTTKTAEHISVGPADRNTDMAVNFSNGSNPNFLDVAKKITDERNSTASPKETVSTLESSNVIFSTCRSMPSLDDDGVDLFCSTPQSLKNSESNVIAFSTEHLGHNNSFVQQDENTIYSAIEFDRAELFQSTSDSSKTGNFSRNTQTTSKSNVKGEIIKGMSLLEIEKDFDDSLMDLGNCLDDDLLSLAPSSCFNSPLDDRFVDSNFLDIEEPKAKQCADSSTSDTVVAPRSHLEAGLPILHEDELNNALKIFKIPRMKQLKSSADRSPEKKCTVKLSPKLNDKQSTSTSSFSSPPPPPPKLESLTHNVSSKHSNISAGTPQTMSTLEISKIFGSLCFTFLSDVCFESSCKFSHQFIDFRIINISVSLLRVEVLHSAYRFIWRHYKLFKLYFPIFCEEYGRRNMRRKFSTMVRDCELQPKCISYLRNIYSALSGCGFSKVNACRFVLSKVKDRSDITIDILLEIIIESDAKMFVSAIEQFSKLEGYKFAMNIINELATTCLRSGNAELVPVLIKCLINVDQAEFLTMRSPELIELLEMIKNGDGV